MDVSNELHQGPTFSLDHCESVAILDVFAESGRIFQHLAAKDKLKRCNRF